MVKPLGWILPLIFICVVILGGCQVGPSNFPTVAHLAATGQAKSADLALLARGRKIYSTSCTECHVAQPVAHFSGTQWLRLVEIMAPRAHLNVRDRAALERYLVTARQSLP